MVNGRKIRDLREAEGLTVIEFGKKVNTSHTTICHIELGIKPPSVALLQRIAKCLGCTVNDLLIDNDDTA